MKPLHLLGIIDILAAISLALLYWDIHFIPYVLLGLFLIKAILFFASVASFIDIIASIIFVLAIMGIMFNILSWIAALWILQKGIISLVS